MSSKELVAVYGTLRKGSGNHRLLLNSELVSTERLKGFLMKSAGGFPVVFHGNSEITVEVYEVPISDMKYLDGLECHPTWYRRELVNTSKGKAWMYIMQQEYSTPVVESGDWLEYTGEVA